MNMALKIIKDSVRGLLKTIQSARENEREELLQWYFGSGTEDLVAQYFDTTTLREVPIFKSNITKRMIDARALTYKEPPLRKADEKYLDMLWNLDQECRSAEKFLLLLGTIGFLSIWQEDKLEHSAIYDFRPMFRSGETKPYGVIYPELNFGGDEPNWIVWTDEWNFRVDSHGEVLPDPNNPEMINPYGVLPVTFLHKFPPIAPNWWCEGATDIAETNRSVMIALTNLLLHIHFGALGGIKYVTGVHNPHDVSLSTGANKLIYLPEGVTMGSILPGGSITEALDGIKGMVELTAKNNHLNISWSGTGEATKSGVALAISNIENTEQRQASVQDIWRNFEKERFQVDRSIIEYHSGVKITDEHSVDFAEPQPFLTKDEEQKLWEWKWKHGLATKKDWFKKNNPDMDEDEIDKLLGEVKEEKEEETPSLLGGNIGKISL